MRVGTVKLYCHVGHFGCTGNQTNERTLFNSTDSSGTHFCCLKLSFACKNMYVSYLVNLQSFLDNSAYNVSMNTIVDSLKIYTDRAVGKCIKLFLWLPSKLRDSQNLSVNFFLKHPVHSWKALYSLKGLYSCKRSI